MNQKRSTKMQGGYFDLLILGREIGGRAVAKEFGWPLVRLAHDLIYSPLTEERKKVIIDALISAINSTEYWEGIGFLPLKKVRVRYSGIKPEILNFIAESILGTVMKYRDSALRQDYGICARQFCHGIEWTIVQADRMYFTGSASIDWIPRLQS